MLSPVKGLLKKRNFGVGFCSPTWVELFWFFSIGCAWL